VLLLGATVVSGTAALVSLSLAASWQNSIRSLMGLAPVDSAHPFRVLAIALPVFVVLLAAGRLFDLVIHTVAGRLTRIIPRKIAHAAGVAAALFAFWSLIDGVLFRGLLNTMDASWRQIDELIPPDAEPPTDPAR